MLLSLFSTVWGTVNQRMTLLCLIYKKDSLVELVKKSGSLDLSASRKKKKKEKNNYNLNRKAFKNLSVFTKYDREKKTDFLNYFFFNETKMLCSDCMVQIHFAETALSRVGLQWHYISCDIITLSLQNIWALLKLNAYLVSESNSRLLCMRSLFFF